MISSKNGNRRRVFGKGGYTLVEVLVAAGMLVTLAVAWGSFVRGFGRISKKGRFDVHLTKEHKAVLGTVATIPRSALLLQNCVFTDKALNPAIFGNEQNQPPGGFIRPHPYRFVNPANDHCLPRGNPARPNGTNNPIDAPEYITNTRQLYDDLWDWPNRGPARYGGSVLNNNLQAARAATLAADAVASGCTVCHDGVGGASKGAGNKSQVPDWIKDCDFSQPAAWRDDLAPCDANLQRPLTSRNMLTSRMGQLFLPHETRTPNAWKSMNQYFTNYLLNRQQTGATALGLGFLSYGSVIQSFIRFESPNIVTDAGTTTFRTTQSAACGTNCAPPEAMVPGSCADVCINTDTDTGKCSCGKDCFQPCPPKCVGFIKQYECFGNVAGKVVPIPRMSVASGALNPDPSMPAAVQSLSSAVIPP